MDNPVFPSPAPPLKLKPNLPKFLFILLPLLVITLLAGTIFIIKPFNLFQPTSSPIPTIIPLTYGIAGEVHESTSSAKKEDKFQKYKVTIDDTPNQTIEIRSYESTAAAQSNPNNFRVSTEKSKKTQKEAFSEIYPGTDLSKLIQISGTVLEVEISSQSLKISSENASGWIKISANWHGNTLIKDPQNAGYMQKEIINVPKGDWVKMAGLLKQSKKVLLLCTDSACKESIGGHIYLD